MSAYIVFIRDGMKDTELFAQYGAAAAGAAAGHAISPLAFYGELETLEGPEAEGVVIVGFPDADAAKAWYNSDKYQAAKAIREKAADYRVILVNGLG